MNAPVLQPGGRINEALPIKPVKIAVLTISDTRDEESDTSGHVLAGRVTDAGHVLVGKAIVPDDIAAIRQQVSDWIDAGEVEAIVTTGGTGITGRDVTPE
ncbi:MAG: moaB, partial [Frankiales bacterium]|nr:moaB [Frankiales bacterium]